MILQQAESVDIKTIEQMIEEDKKYQIPTNKAHFEDVLVIGQSSIIANQIILFLSDYFLVKTGIGLVNNNNYFINIHNKKEIDSNTSEKNNFTDVRTTICFSNTSNRHSFIVSYTTLSDTFYISFQKNFVFDSTITNYKKEFSGFIKLQTYYMLAFASVIYEYLENGILDLEVSVSSIALH